MEDNIKVERHLHVEIVNITHKCGHTVARRLCGYENAPFTKEEQIKRAIGLYKAIDCPVCLNGN